MKVIINAAMSIDGKIATIEGDSKISSLSDLKRVHRLRNNVDAILVGISTVIRDNPLLTIRYTNDKNKMKNPIRVIIDSKARIPLRSKIVRTANQIETKLIVTTKAPVRKLKKLEEKGLKIITSEQETKGEEKVNLKNVLSQLENEGITKILVEGGGEINWSIIKNNLFDEMIITVSPIIIGGKNATSLVGGKGYKKINESAKMKLINVHKNNNGEIVLYYKNIKN